MKGECSTHVRVVELLFRVTHTWAELSHPTLTRRAITALPQSPIYLSCSQARIGGNFVAATIVTPHSRYPAT